MMAMLYAQSVMMAEREFKDVPKYFMRQVAKILVDSGAGDLIGDYQF